MTRVAEDPYDVCSLTETAGHFPPDPVKVTALAESMRTNGWLGAPLLSWGEVALNGVHRIAAARQTCTPIPLLPLSELLDHADATIEHVMQLTGWDSVIAAAALVEVVLGHETSHALGNDLDFDLSELDVNELVLQPRPEGLTQATAATATTINNDGDAS